MMYLYLKKRRFLYLIKNEMAKFKENENSYISDINVFPLLTTDHGLVTGKLYYLRLRVKCTLFIIYKAGREPTPYW
jgi:hypothetical protein